MAEKINRDEYVVGMSIQFTAAILRSGSQLGAEIIGIETAESLLTILEKNGNIEFSQERGAI